MQRQVARRCSLAARRLPASMRAVVVGPPEAGKKRPGPGSLMLGEVARPEPKPDEVLIQVAAAGVSRPDVMQRLGIYPPPAGHSQTLGLEVAGRIVAAGAEVSGKGLAVGDAVCALANGGGYAEYCSVPHGQVMPVPSGFTMAEAACLPETFFTVWQVLRHTNHMGERVFNRRHPPSLLVHGGTSGIGATAIQLACALGAEHIFATAGSDEKCTFCVDRLGATHAINYRTTPDFSKAVLEATNGKGLDFVLDIVVGKGYTDQNLQVLGRGGRLAIIGFLGGAKVEANFTSILTKGLTINGSTLRSAPGSEKASIAQELAEQVWPLLADRRVKVFVDSEYDFENAAGAHARLEEGTHIGKVCLKVADI